MCTVLLPPGVYPIAVNKYIISCPIPSPWAECDLRGSLIASGHLIVIIRDGYLSSCEETGREGEREVFYLTTLSVTNIVLWMLTRGWSTGGMTPTGRRDTKTHADSNWCHSERDCHRSTTATQLWNTDMSTSSNHTKAFVQCCHGKHTVLSSLTLLSDHVRALFQYISNNMQRYTVHSYLENCSTCFGWRYHPKHVEQFSRYECTVLCCILLDKQGVTGGTDQTSGGCSLC